MKTITITDPTQIEEIIRKCPYCIVGITDLEGNPYTVPMNFAYQDGVIYLHSGPEGSKVEMVTKHPQVCITFCEGHELVYMHRQDCGMQLQHEVAQCYLSWESTLRGRHGREATRTRHADEAIYGK